MNKVFILLQDTPSHEKGEEFYYRDVFKCYCSIHTAKGFELMFPPEFVENKPEWFKIKEEKVWTDSDMIEFARMIGGTDQNALAWFENFKKLKTI
jgi:hypothetical protein